MIDFIFLFKKGFATLVVFVTFCRHQISKTLVDVQLENNRIQEDAEATNFDLGNKVSVVQSSLSGFQMMAHMHECFINC